MATADGVLRAFDAFDSCFPVRPPGFSRDPAAFLSAWLDILHDVPDARLHRAVDAWRRSAAGGWPAPGALRAAALDEGGEHRPTATRDTTNDGVSELLWGRLLRLAAVRRSPPRRGVPQGWSLPDDLRPSLRALPTASDADDVWRAVHESTPSEIAAVMRLVFDRDDDGAAMVAVLLALRERHDVCAPPRPADWWWVTTCGPTNDAVCDCLDAVGGWPVVRAVAFDGSVPTAAAARATFRRCAVSTGLPGLLRSVRLDDLGSVEVVTPSPVHRSVARRALMLPAEAQGEQLSFEIVDGRLAGTRAAC